MNLLTQAVRTRSDHIMANEEAYSLIGDRTKELLELPEVKEMAVRIAKQNGREAAVKQIYLLAIATLYGMR